MAAFAEMKVSVASRSENAALCIFHEDLPEETECWVPLSVIEDPSALDEEDADANVTISVKKWFLKNNDIPYES